MRPSPGASKAGELWAGDRTDEGQPEKTNQKNNKARTAKCENRTFHFQQKRSTKDDSSQVELRAKSLFQYLVFIK